MVDSWTIVYTVGALVPNLLVMLWIMARMSGQVRLLASKLESVEREMRMVDEGVKQLTEDLRRTNGRAPSQPKIVPEATPAPSPSYKRPV